MFLLLQLFNSYLERLFDCLRVYTLRNPVTSLELYRTISDVLPIHLSHRLDVVVLTENGHEPISLGLECFLVPHHLGLDEGIVFLEGVCENIIRDFIPQIATEYSVVVVRPVFKRRVLPLLTRSLPGYLRLRLLIIFVL